MSRRIYNGTGKFRLRGEFLALFGRLKHQNNWNDLNLDRNREAPADILGHEKAAVSVKHAANLGLAFFPASTTSRNATPVETLVYSSNLLRFLCKFLELFALAAPFVRLRWDFYSVQMSLWPISGAAGQRPLTLRAASSSQSRNSGCLAFLQPLFWIFPDLGLASDRPTAWLSCSKDDASRHRVSFVLTVV